MKLNCQRIPLQVALGAFLVYLLTLCRGVTAGNLGLAAKIAGWDWQPIVGSPLIWLCSLPFRALPVAWIPAALNVFAAACGAAVLGILARTLELLPPLRPFLATGGWRPRLPFLLAVTVCGLEFHFWQNATAVLPEMVDLLPLALAVLCTLEFHAGKNERWLHLASFIWGLGDRVHFSGPVHELVLGHG